MVHKFSQTSASTPPPPHGWLPFDFFYLFFAFHLSCILTFCSLGVRRGWPQGRVFERGKLYTLSSQIQINSSSLPTPALNSNWYFSHTVTFKQKKWICALIITRPEIDRSSGTQCLVFNGYIFIWRLEVLPAFSLDRSPSLSSIWLSRGNTEKLRSKPLVLLGKGCRQESHRGREFTEVLTDCHPPCRK